MFGKLSVCTDHVCCCNGQTGLFLSICYPTDIKRNSRISYDFDISSFAVAGALVLLVLAVEMIFGVEIFKNDSPCGSATIVPLVFPLIAGAASFTTLLSLRAEYHIFNIIIAVAMNMALVYLVLRYVYYVERLFGKSGVYVMRKLFGIILLAIAVRLFTSNLTSLIGSF